MSRKMSFSLLGAGLLGALAVIVLQQGLPWTTSVSAEPVVTYQNFLGIAPISAEQVVSLYPENKVLPVVIEFKHKYCKDCKRMAPYIKDVSKAYPDVKTDVIDVFDGQKNGKADILDAFQPFATPTLISVKPNGQIKEVLVGYQDKERLETFYNSLKPVH